jgi:hypothetical protein
MLKENLNRKDSKKQNTANRQSKIFPDLVPACPG